VEPAPLTSISAVERRFTSTADPRLEALIRVLVGALEPEFVPDGFIVLLETS